MRALISSADTRVEGDLRQLAGWGYPQPAGDLYFFSQTSGLPYFPPSARYIGSIYLLTGSVLFDEIFIGPSVRLFNTLWGQAFLRRCAGLAAPEGRLTVPVFPGPIAMRNGYFSLAALQGLFGPNAVEQGSSGSVAHVRHSSVPLKNESVLDWYFANTHEVLSAEMLTRANPEFPHWVRTSDRFLEFLYSQPERIVVGSRKRLAEVEWTSAALDARVESEMKRALLAQSYYINGIAYKAALLSHIVREHGLDTGKFSILDLGGGYGLLAAEMLLTFGSTIERAVVCDPSTANLVLSEALYRGMRACLSQRFFFHLGTAEEFVFDGKYNLIMFIGSMLYVPRYKLVSLLERCVDSLEKEGILVVHENIRHLSHGNDYDKMFAVADLDELLGRFGAIKRYMSTVAREVTAEQAGEKSVFRVVRKG